MTSPTRFALFLLAVVAVVAAAVAAQKPIRVPAGANEKIAGAPSSLPVLADRMPAFAGITNWWNTPDGKPLTPESLKGKVVLVDFWTYSCINCIRTYPFLKALYAKYEDTGLVIVGVHTPEFAFEAVPENVGREITNNGLAYPIALDPDYATWNAYGNQSWPAEYFFDREGRLRRTHFGEGEYDQSEEAIRELLAEAPGVTLGAAGTPAQTPDFSKIKTEETYFGLARGSAFMGRAGTRGTDVALTASLTPLPDRWTAGGTWRFENEYAEARSAGDIFRMSVQASKMHAVLSSGDGADKTLEIFVDGVYMKDLIVNAATLYDIADFGADAQRHTVEIRLKDAGVRFYAATFS